MSARFYCILFTPVEVPILEACLTGRPCSRYKVNDYYLSIYLFFSFASWLGTLQTNKMCVICNLRKYRYPRIDPANHFDARRQNHSCVTTQLGITYLADRVVTHTNMADS